MQRKMTKLSNLLTLNGCRLSLLVVFEVLMSNGLLKINSSLVVEFCSSSDGDQTQKTKAGGEVKVSS